MPDGCRDVFLLGSTGSIGTQTLEVISAHPNRFKVRALAAGGGQLPLLAAQTAQFRPDYVALSDPSKLAPFRRCLQARLEKEIPGLRHNGEGAPGFSGSPSQDPGGGAAPTQHLAGRGGLAGDTDGFPPTPSSDIIAERERNYAADYFPELIAGPQAAAEVCQRADSQAVVMNGITGGVGLKPTLAALESGATLGLANKESLVVGGSLVKKSMVRPAQIVPVDSEHSAIAQCLTSGIHRRGLCSPDLSGESQVHQLVLTASGGPFRGLKRAQLKSVTPQQALNHPTWNMGPVVTINSSTLVNKGLELIEAHLLFDIPAAQIHPLIHPQSLIHSMVTWQDGATIAQVSVPDMKLPISLGLSLRRLSQVCTPMDWSKAQDWHFEPVDKQTFPALKLARWAIEASDTHPAVYNAANEVLVRRFCQEKLPYLGIVDCLGEVLEAYPGANSPDLKQIEGVESWARAKALEVAKGKA